MSPLITCGLVVMGFGGFWMIVTGVLGRPARPPPALPQAKISDGRGFPTPPRTERSFSAIVAGVCLIGIAGFGAWFLYSLRDAFSLKLGRPFRVRKRPWLGPRRRGAGCDDGTRPALHGLGAWRRAALGERWLASARTEHASVPAFDRLADQLTRLAAPAALIERCHAARADEVRHAERCFTLARAYAGVPWVGAALPAATPAPVELSALALESLHDGCVGEGVAADLAAAAAARAPDPVIAGSLAMIAADEARHAELAWSVVELCIARGGAPVRAALAAATLDTSVPAAGPLPLRRRARRQLAASRAALVRARLATLLASAATA